MVMQPLRTTVSPATVSASSIYSKRSSISSSSSYSRPQTRSSGTSVSNSNGNNMMNNGGIQVESPRLPFRDWVHGIKLSNEAGEAGLEGTSSGQRDSGLALQCDLCCTEPCQCGGGGSYADQLSAFMTPAPGHGAGQPGSMTTNASNNGDIDWAAHYGAGLMLAGDLLTAPSHDRNNANEGYGSVN